MSNSKYLARLRHIAELDEPDEVVRLLNQMNKNQTIPSLVFNSLGQLRSFDFLYGLALTMIQYNRSPYEFTESLLLQEGKKHETAVRTIRAQEPAFNNIEQQRAYYLQHPIAKDIPILFYDRHGLPLKSLNY